MIQVRKFLRNQSWTRLMVSLLLVLAAVRCLYAASSYSMDFDVYWNAVGTWLRGGAPYAPVHAHDPGFVFKYPPWILPFFLPFHLLPLGVSRIVWATLSLGAIAFSFQTLVLLGVSLRIVLTVGFMFWYIWLGHFYSGQINILVLASALWVIRQSKSSFWDVLKTAALCFLLSAKAFSLVTLAGIWKRVFTLRVFTLLAGVFVFSNLLLIFLPLLFAPHELIASHGITRLKELYLAWLSAMGSGATQLGAEAVRGQFNHGFVAGVLRWIDPQGKALYLDVLGFVFFALVLGGLWAKLGKRLEPAERWSGWLAYGVIVHPLAWHHSFVLAFPLGTFALDAATKAGKRRRFLIAAALFGICLIGLIVPNVIGSWVTPFEYVASKSWGVVICAYVLWNARK